MRNEEHAIVYFDGVCNLCNGFVQFVVKRDPDGFFHFASLQSDFTEEHLDIPLTTNGSYETVIVEYGDQLLQHSDAVLFVLARLRGPVRWFGVFRFIPKGIRDAVYKWIARSRYKVFGKRDSCMVPTPDLKDRFVTGLD